MDAWNDHIQAVLNDPNIVDGPQDGQDGLVLAPQLQAHFTRAYEILKQIGRKAA